ncbi:hypothetical protein B5807_10838 [Epicoccum nigrum]|uniref:Uncharacterized protein n=1 Tax=Epicoccum nigrum TaxID=105696 RepID=A0A1Y2LLB4_EPING|nr:hypothetical protein B5807_10838 [Epicoccum nigrum]
MKTCSSTLHLSPRSNRHPPTNFHPERAPLLQPRDRTLAQPPRRNKKLHPLLHARQARHTRARHLVLVRIARLDETRHGARVRLVREGIGLLHGVDLVPVDGVARVLRGRDGVLDQPPFPRRLAEPQRRARQHEVAVQQAGAHVRGVVGDALCGASRRVQCFRAGEVGGGQVREEALEPEMEGRGGSVEPLAAAAAAAAAARPRAPEARGHKVLPLVEVVARQHGGGVQRPPAPHHLAQRPGEERIVDDGAPGERAGGVLPTGGDGERARPERLHVRPLQTSDLIRCVGATHVARDPPEHGLAILAVVPRRLGPKRRARHGPPEQLPPPIPRRYRLRHHAPSPRALAPDGNLAPIPPKRVDVLLDPLQRRPLIQQPRIQIHIPPAPHLPPGEEPEDVGAIVGVDDHVVILLARVQHGEPWRRDGELSGPADEPAAVEGQQHGSQRLAPRPRPRIHPQVQAVLGAVDAPLRAHVEAAVRRVDGAVADGERRLRRPEPVLAPRRGAEGDPPVVGEVVGGRRGAEERDVVEGYQGGWRGCWLRGGDGGCGGVGEESYEALAE